METRGIKNPKRGAKKQRPPAKKTRATKKAPPQLNPPVAKITNVDKHDDDTLLDEALARYVAANSEFANSTRHTKQHTQKRDKLMNDFITSFSDPNAKLLSPKLLELIPNVDAGESPYVLSLVGGEITASKRKLASNLLLYWISRKKNLNVEPLRGFSNQTQ